MRNSGEIETYCRVTIYKRWLNSEGEKAVTLSPGLIELNIPEGNGWIIDEQVLTEERVNLYYTKPLQAGETSPNMIDSIKISPEINNKVTQTSTEIDSNGNQTITTSYTYNGYKFNILINVDAIQTHNAEDSIWSAWGKKVNIAEDGTLSFP